MLCTQGHLVLLARVGEEGDNETENSAARSDAEVDGAAAVVCLLALHALRAPVHIIEVCHRCGAPGARSLRRQPRKDHKSARARK